MDIKVYGTFTLSDAPFQETYLETSRSPKTLAPHGGYAKRTASGLGSALFTRRY